MEQNEVRIETAAYNERRYGRPWIAKVVLNADGKLEYQWGNWIGDHANGSSGELQLTINPLDVYARGQKDFRKPKNSAPDFYISTTQGKCVAVDKVDAVRHLQGGDIGVQSINDIRAAAAIQDVASA
jgi:hypothetical protein